MVILTFITAVSDEDVMPALGVAQLVWAYLVINLFALLALATDTPTNTPDCWSNTKQPLITANVSPNPSMVRLRNEKS